MSEADAIARSTRGPVTREWLKRDLDALGVRPGMLLMVHASLSALGWVIGGAPTVVAALRDAIGEEGTLLMPTHTGANSDPAEWCSPPVPEEWKDTIRAETPAFDPATSPTREMGAIAEYFRTLPGTMRSVHPSASWAAQGPLVEQVTRTGSGSLLHGEQPPLVQCYERGGSVLTLGTRRTTIIHLAEHKAQFAGKNYRRFGGAMLVDGRRQWVVYEDVEENEEDFERIRQDYIAAGRPCSIGPVAYAESRMFPARELVDFAVEWIETNRRAE